MTKKLNEHYQVFEASEYSVAILKFITFQFEYDIKI